MMKMTHKKRLKLIGLCEILNSILEDQARKKIRNEILGHHGIGFKRFDLDISRHEFDSGEVVWSCEFYSQSMEFKEIGISSEFVSSLAWCGHRPSSVKLFSEDCSNDDFGFVVGFIRKAIKNNGLDGMKFGVIKVVSEMVDYLDFEINA